MPLTPSCSRCGTPLTDPDETESCPVCLLALGLDTDMTGPGNEHPLDPIHDYLPDLPPHYQLETRVGTGGMGIVYRATQVPLGFAVMPRRCTRRVACSAKNRTYSRWPSSVSTQKKSVARMPWMR